MLIQCPECGKELSDKAVSCPHCGYPINILPEAESTHRADDFGISEDCREEAAQNPCKKRRVFVVLPAIFTVVFIAFMAMFPQYQSASINLASLPAACIASSTLSFQSPSDGEDIEHVVSVLKSALVQSAPNEVISDVYYSEEIGAYVVEWTSYGLMENMAGLYIASPDEALSQWQNLCDIWCGASSALMEICADAGGVSPVVLFIKNDKDPTKVLLGALDGEVFFDTISEEWF